MTDEDEEGYEIAKKYLIKKYGDDYVDFIETEGQSYLDGLEEGMEELEQWKREWQDAQIKANEEGFARTTLQIKYSELEKENEKLKKQIEQLSNDNHVLKTAFIDQQNQIEKMKNYCDCEHYVNVISGDEFTVEDTNKTVCEFCMENNKNNWELKE